MVDERMVTLAKNLVGYSCDVKPGENVLIDLYNVPSTVGEQLVKAVYCAGGNPFVQVHDEKVERQMLREVKDRQLEQMAQVDCSLMSKMQGYIAFRGSDNDSEKSDVPVEKQQQYGKLYSEPVHSEIRVKKTKWVVLRYPTSSMAQGAKMSTEAFEDFYFNVCNLDYGKMSIAMDALVALMSKTDRVHITGKGTDLSFSIKDMNPIKCDGLRNIPDGEVYTAPVKDSVNGVISYTAPSIYRGFKFENVVLTFEKGKVTKATANDNERIEGIFNTDEGARFVGEFAIGVNPLIEQPMGDILFDEKISGSFHFTPGMAYEDADNGNRSAVHWDLVCIQTPEYGGGEMYFDEVLIRKDGLFVLPELLCLNPENLL